MRKLIIFVGLLSTFSAQAEMIVRMPMEDYLPTNYDYMYEVKTANYQKIILDCQGFIMGMSFIHNDLLERKVYMDEEVCQDVNNFLSESKKASEPVCIELNLDVNALTFSRKTSDCQ